MVKYDLRVCLEYRTRKQEPYQFAGRNYRELRQFEESHQMALNTTACLEALSGAIFNFMTCQDLFIE